MLMILHLAEPMRVEVHWPYACGACAFHIGLDTVSHMEGSVGRHARLREREDEDARIRLGDANDRRIEHRGDRRAPPAPDLADAH